MLGTADAHRQRALEPEQPPHDHRPVRPRACPRHHQPVPSRLGRERPVPPVRRDPPVQIPGIPYKFSRSAHSTDATPLLRFSNTHPTRSTPPDPEPSQPGAIHPRFPHPHHKSQTEFNESGVLPILFSRAPLSLTRAAARPAPPGGGPAGGR